MARIENFTMSDFLNIQEKYSDMSVLIENRCREIAIDFGKIDATWNILDFEMFADSFKQNVRAVFSKNNLAIKFVFNADWLFSDDYKELLTQEKVNENVTKNKEYLEYLRLKEKFEGNEGL